MIIHIDMMDEDIEVSEDQLKVAQNICKLLDSQDITVKSKYTKDMEKVIAIRMIMDYVPLAFARDQMRYYKQEKIKAEWRKRELNEYFDEMLKDAEYEN